MSRQMKLGRLDSYCDLLLMDKSFFESTLLIPEVESLSNLWYARRLELMPEAGKLPYQ